MVVDGLTKALDSKLLKVFWTIIGIYWIGSHKIIKWECSKCSHFMLANCISLILCFMLHVSPVPCLICSVSHYIPHITIFHISLYSASHYVPHLTMFHVSLYSTSHYFPCFTIFCVLFVPRLTLHLICSMSHIFRVSRLRPFFHSHILSQL